MHQVRCNSKRRLPLGSAQLRESCIDKPHDALITKLAQQGVEQITHGRLGTIAIKGPVLQLETQRMGFISSERAVTGHSCQSHCSKCFCACHGIDEAVHI